MAAEFDYRAALESIGFKYSGPCSCRVNKGYIFRSPLNNGIELWVYPSRKWIKKREYDISRETLEYTPDTFLTLAKTMAGL